jgi:hypothetical protein
MLSSNLAGWSGGGAASSTLNNCTLSGNSQSVVSFDVVGGGGAADSTVNNCTLSGNSAYYGGGAFGGTLSNCTLSSNSAGYLGGGASRSTLNNCVLSGNRAILSGGGVLLSTLNNCMLTSNSAVYGGGAEQGVLNNCVLSRNSASQGGGVSDSTLNNCTLTGNSAGYGGGASTGRLKNCVLYFNTADSGANYDSTSTLTYCCTTPQPTNGFSNITNAPLFVDLAGGNLRLQSNFPCINAGNNAYAPTGSDLDGSPRIAGGTVDIGAYEFQTPTSSISYAWLQRYGLPNNGSADFADTDGDGMNNWQEWRVGTSPTNPSSVLRLLHPAVTSTNGTLSWQSVLGISYFLERSTNLTAPRSFAPVATGIPGQDGVTSYADTNLVRSGPVFYRVGVGN